jgi:hypothetical protein
MGRPLDLADPRRRDEAAAIDVEGAMRRTLNLVRAAVLYAATTAALGFGARQALAGPEQAESGRFCTTAGCTAYCQAAAGPEATGRCTPQGVCVCMFPAD